MVGLGCSVIFALPGDLAESIQILCHGGARWSLFLLHFLRASVVLLCSVQISLFPRNIPQIVEGSGRFARRQQAQGLFQIVSCVVQVTLNKLHPTQVVEKRWYFPVLRVGLFHHAKRAAKQLFRVGPVTSVRSNNAAAVEDSGQRRTTGLQGLDDCSRFLVIFFRLAQVASSPCESSKLLQSQRQVATFWRNPLFDGQRFLEQVLSVCECTTLTLHGA